MMNNLSDFRNVDEEVMVRSGILGVCRAYTKDQKLDYSLRIGDYATLHSKLVQGPEEEICVRVKIVGFENGLILGETVDNYYNPIPVGTKIAFSESRVMSVSDI